MSQRIEVFPHVREAAEKCASARRAWLLSKGHQPALEAEYREAACDLAAYAGIAILGATEWSRLSGQTEYERAGAAVDAARAAKRAAEPAEVPA